MKISFFILFCSFSEYFVLPAQTTFVNPGAFSSGRIRRLLFVELGDGDDDVVGGCIFELALFELLTGLSVFKLAA